MQVKWLATAVRNLDAEADYLAKDSPASARAFVEHVIRSVSQLATHPHLGRPGRVSGTRELVITRFPYVLPYRIRESRVEILRVFHASRSWPDRL